MADHRQGAGSPADTSLGDISLSLTLPRSQWRLLLQALGQGVHLPVFSDAERVMLRALVVRLQAEEARDHDTEADD